jgi:hypothetical protein
MTDSVRDKLARSSEDALGKLAQDLLENPLVNGAISRAFEARERAVQAQEAAMGALNIPSAADIERLTRRLRSVSQRLEGIEDGGDRAPGGHRGPSCRAERRARVAVLVARRPPGAAAARAGAPGGRRQAEGEGEAGAQEGEELARRQARQLAA